MLEGNVSGDLDDLLAHLARLQHPDLRPLADDIAGTVVEGNRVGLLAGTDGNGAPFAPLAHDSKEESGRGQRQGSTPLLPEGEASKLIVRFEATVEPSDDGGLKLHAGWRGMPELRYLAEGTRSMPARDPRGLRPDTREKIQEILDNFARGLTLD